MYSCGLARHCWLTAAMNELQGIHRQWSSTQFTEGCLNEGLNFGSCYATLYPGQTDVDFNQDVIECKKLFYQKIEYCRSAIYICGVSDRDDQPIFGQVTSIVKKKAKWCLVVDLFGNRSIRRRPRRMGAENRWGLRSEESVDGFKAFSTIQRTDIYSLENEIDGATLALMDTVEKIAAVILKLKYQLTLLKERDAGVEGVESSTKSTEEKHDDSFPEKYIIPLWTSSLLKDIDDGSLRMISSMNINSCEESTTRLWIALIGFVLSYI